MSISFGTDEYLSEHPELRAPSGAYGFARNRVKEMARGDLLIPFLKDNRIGRIAEFQSEAIDTWAPLWGDKDGRRIKVSWQSDNCPPADKVALIPFDLRKPNRRTINKLSPERFLALAGVLADSSNWQDMPSVSRPDDETDEVHDPDIFRMESHLEEFIEANWSRIDFGRSLELCQDEQSSGRQYPAPPIGTIDLLAKDRDTNDFVVIELKKTPSDDKVVGQLLRYMGWVKKNLANGGMVTGIIIVPEVSERLKYAADMLPSVRVMTYSVSFALSPWES
ncbi:MAG TPA: endonuclease NucS domain-containing protein [Dehalococcoidia bacterium]|nr:endonuclease NucS domain-containing protein [Dehalococcoidia bacterium]